MLRNVDDFVLLTEKKETDIKENYRGVGMGRKTEKCIYLLIIF